MPTETTEVILEPRQARQPFNFHIAFWVVAIVGCLVSGAVGIIRYTYTHDQEGVQYHVSDYLTKMGLPDLRVDQPLQLGAPISGSVGTVTGHFSLLGGSMNGESHLSRAVTISIITDDGRAYPTILTFEQIQFVVRSSSPPLIRYEYDDTQTDDGLCKTPKDIQACLTNSPRYRDILDKGPFRLLTDPKGSDTPAPLKKIWVTLSQADYSKFVLGN
jgi:hypothetical protein